MNKPAIFFAVFITLSCHRKTPVEYLPLSPSGSTEKWWIINSVSTDAANRRLHQSMLLTLKPTDDHVFAAGYASSWVSGDKQALSGVRQTHAPLWGASRKYPFYCILPDADSTGVDWNWSLGMQRSKFQTFFNHEPDGILCKSRLKFDAANLLPVRLISEEMAVFCARPAVFAGKIINPERFKPEGTLHISVIEKGGPLLNLVQAGRVIWLDFDLGINYVTRLIHLDQSGKCTVLAAAVWNENNESQAEKNTIEVEQTGDFWQSSVSGKRYPLNWEIKDNPTSRKWTVRPLLDNQEIIAGKNSLWMGAVEITDAATGRTAGFGNMIIL